MFPIVPSLTDERILSFCRQVSPGQQPIYVEHQPLAGQPLRECFSIVPQHIAANGGQQHFGWAVIEIQNLWIEAEFHTIWQSEDGRVIDLSPREIPLDKILFFPDPKRQYEGRQVQSFYHPLTDKPSVKKYLQLTAEFFEAMNEGDLANVVRGKVRSPRALKIKKEIDKAMYLIAMEHTQGIVRK